MTPAKHLQREHGEGSDSHTPQTGNAANDSTPRAEPDTRNPLWTVVIGMAVLFGTMAAIFTLAG